MGRRGQEPPRSPIGPGSGSRDLPGCSQGGNPLEIHQIEGREPCRGGSGLAFVNTPTNAAPFDDGTGVDFDAACILGNPAAPTPTPNYIPSPGAPGGSLALPPAGDGCDGISLYDGDTESTDLRNVDLFKNAAGQLEASFSADGGIPAAGSATPPALGAGLPNNFFVGVGYKALYQNPDLQNNTPYVAATRITGTPIFGLNEHWGDGFHLFVGFDAVWDGARWIHSAQVGTLDAGPDGGFFFDELGVSTAPGVWSTDDPCMPHGTSWDVVYGPGNTVNVKVNGVVKFSNVQAVGGCIEAWYAKAGNSITNVKFLSTADFTVTLPVTIPLSLIPGFSDITSIGGIVFPSDMTHGSSRNVGLNATLAAATGDNAGTPCVNEGILGNRLCVSFTGGLFGLADKLGALVTSNFPPDTLGDGPRCWTSTVGGVLPANPLWVPNQPCYIDDDNIPGPTGNVDPGQRGSILAEWWETSVGFTF